MQISNIESKILIKLISIPEYDEATESESVPLLFHFTCSVILAAGLGTVKGHLSKENRGKGHCKYKKALAY